MYTAISRKVVGKSARDNPERHCGWFWVLFFSKKFEGIGTKGRGNVFASVKGKQQKLVRQLQSSGTVYWSYPILPFGIVACTFFPTTFLEIAVFKFQTLSCQNFWIFYFTSRLTLYECVVNVCIQRWFLIRNWIIASCFTGAVFLDLSKAFNTMDHHLLL